MFHTGHELINQCLFDFAFLLSFSILLGSLLGPFLIDNSFLSISKLSSLLSAEGKSIMSLVPMKRQLDPYGLLILNGGLCIHNN